MGSARSDGDTAAVAMELTDLTGFKFLDLNTIEFSDYDYQSKNINDDFLPTIRHIVDIHDHVIWLTPVYWYSMSAIMKRFIDRISDCLRIEKETGRKFRGMSMSLVSVSNDVRHNNFGLPFELTADYLGMQYFGDQHVIVNHENNINKQLLKLVKTIKNLDHK